jgi:predicted esterase
LSIGAASAGLRLTKTYGRWSAARSAVSSVPACARDSTIAGQTRRTSFAANAEIDIKAARSRECCGTEAACRPLLARISRQTRLAGFSRGTTVAAASTFSAGPTIASTTTYTPGAPFTAGPAMSPAGYATRHTD